MAALPGLAAFSVAYVLSQFFRTAIAVVAPELARDLHLDPTRLGILSSAWFWAFAAAQIPIGIALDRWGSRRTVDSCSSSPGRVPGVRCGGGTGCGRSRTGADRDRLRARVHGHARRGCPILRAASLRGPVLGPAGDGSVGTLTATTPLALTTELVGWRSAFAGMGGAVVLVSALVLLIVRDRPPGTMIAGERETLAAIWDGLRGVLGNRRLWAILPMCFTGYAVLITVRGLWAGPYLATLLDLRPWHAATSSFPCRSR